MFAVEIKEVTAAGDVAAGESEGDLACLAQDKDVVKAVDFEGMTLDGWHTGHGFASFSGRERMGGDGPLPGNHTA
jgi:acyl dehydratase